MGRPVVQIHYLQLSNWEVVQLVEHWSPKPAVVGSIPAFSAHWDVSPLSDKQLKELLVTGEFNSHHPNIGQEEY